MFWRLLDQLPAGPHGGGLFLLLIAIAAVLFAYLGYLLITETP